MKLGTIKKKLGGYIYAFKMHQISVTVWLEKLKYNKELQKKFTKIFVTIIGEDTNAAPEFLVFRAPHAVYHQEKAIQRGHCIKPVIRNLCLAQIKESTSRKSGSCKGTCYSLHLSRLGELFSTANSTYPKLNLPSSFQSPLLFQGLDAWL